MYGNFPRFKIGVNLCDEVIQHILTFTDDKTWLNFVRTCRDYYEWSLEERKRRLLLPFKSYKTLNGHKNSVSHLVVHNNKIIFWGQSKSIRILDLKTGACIKTLNGHTKDVYCLAVHENIIISGSYDNTIRIWDLMTGKCIRILEHAELISCLIVHNNQIISGSYDDTIRIWDLTTGKCIRILNKHIGRISCLVVHNNQIISGSWDKSIRIWDLKTGACIRTLNGHTGWISCLAVHNNIIISGSWDKSIRIWDLKTGACTRILKGHTEYVSCLVVYNNLIISGSQDKTVKIWNLTTGACIRTLNGNTNNGFCFVVRNNQIISGGAKEGSTFDFWDWDLMDYENASVDSTIKIWDLMTGACIRTLNRHTSYVSCLVVHKNIIISGSRDNTTRIWSQISSTTDAITKLSKLTILIQKKDIPHWKTPIENLSKTLALPSTDRIKLEAFSHKLQEIELCNNVQKNPFTDQISTFIKIAKAILWKAGIYCWTKKIIKSNRVVQCLLL